MQRTATLLWNPVIAGRIRSLVSEIDNMLDMEGKEVRKGQDDLFIPAYVLALVLSVNLCGEVY